MKSYLKILVESLQTTKQVVVQRIHETELAALFMKNLPIVKMKLLLTFSRLVKEIYKFRKNQAI